MTTDVDQLNRPRLIRTQTTDSGHAFDVLRELSDSERSQSVEAERLLRHFADSSLLNPVDVTHDALALSISNYLGRLAGPAPIGSEWFSATTTAFDSFLAAFRSFVDKTTQFVSAEFGRDSAPTGPSRIR